MLNATPLARSVEVTFGFWACLAVMSTSLPNVHAGVAVTAITHDARHNAKKMRNLMITRRTRWSYILAVFFKLIGCRNDSCAGVTTHPCHTPNYTHPFQGETARVQQAWCDCSRPLASRVRGYCAPPTRMQKDAGMCSMRAASLQVHQGGIRRRG